MTLAKIKIGINQISDVRINQLTTGPHNGKTQLEIDANYVEAVQQLANASLASGELTPVNAADGTAVQLNDDTSTSRRFNIIGSSSDINPLYHAIKLRDEWKNNVPNGDSADYYENGEVKFVLSYIIVNGKNNGTVGLVKSNSSNTNNDFVWTIEVENDEHVKNFSANKESIVSIDRKKIRSDDNHTKQELPLADKLSELWQLEKLISEARELSAKFADLYTANKSGQNSCLPNPEETENNLIGKYPEPASGDESAKPGSGLKAYVWKINGQPADAPIRNTNSSKHTAYQATESEYSALVPNYLTLLQNLVTWSRWGFKNKYEVVMAMHNGFNIGSSNASDNLSDEEQEEVSNKKYKGFLMIGPEQTVKMDADDNNKLTVEGTLDYTKANIDIHHKAFPGKKDANGVPAMLTKPEECRGFQPGNLSAASGIDGTITYEINGKSYNIDSDAKLEGITNTKSAGKEFTHKQLTKKTFEILSLSSNSDVNDLDKLITEYFHNNNFQEANDKTEVLMMYYIAAQRNTNSLFWNNDNNKTKLNQIYDETLGLLTLLNKDYSKTDTINDEQAAADKTKLEAHKTKFEGLKGKIDEKLTQIENRGNDENNLTTAINNAKTAADEEWKSVYEDNKITSQEILTKVSELITLVKTAKTTSGNQDTLTKLNNYKTKSESTENSPEKTAWEIVNTKRNDDANKENRAQKALEELTNKLGGNKEKAKKAIDAATTATELTTSLNSIAAEITDENEKKKFTENLIPRFKAVWTLKKSDGDKTDDDNKFIELLHKEDKDYTTLKDIEAAIKLMEEYKNASGGDSKASSVTKAGGDDVKTTVIEGWLTEMKAKEKALKTSEDGGSNPSDTPFYKKPLGMISIFVGVVVVVGAIAYFIKQGNSSENDEE